MTDPGLAQEKVQRARRHDHVRALLIGQFGDCALVIPGESRARSTSFRPRRQQIGKRCGDQIGQPAAPGRSAVPMDLKIKGILNAVVVIALIVWLLQVFGLINTITNIHVGK